MTGSEESARHRRIIIWVLRVGALALIVGVWQYVSVNKIVSPLLLPRIDRVAETLWKLVRDTATYADFGVTAMEVVVSFVIAALAGLAVGFWISRRQYTIAVFEQMLMWGYLAPLVLFYPLFILWLGVGVESKITYAAVNAFFPIAYSAVRGFRTVEDRLILMARAYGGNKRQIDFSVKLPAAMTLINPGMRIGAATAMIAVILAEMLSATSGLGHELARSTAGLNSSKTYAFIILLLVVVVVMQSITDATFKERARS